MLDFLHSQPVRQRGVHLERLASDPLSFFDGQRADRAKVVQSIGQLDEQDPHVLRHGDHHLADSGGLGFFAGTEANSVEFRHSVDHPGNFRPEVGLDFFDRYVCIFDGVVE